MSLCDTCKNSCGCKESEAHRRFEELVAVGEEVNCTGYEYQKPLSYVKSAIENAPTADVVEVVRCKDCINWGGVTQGFVCRKFSGIETKICMGADHYCSYGERKENGKS